MNIFVAKLNFRTQEDVLRSRFEEFGIVDSVKIIVDHETGRSKGFGFVEMPNDDEGYEAIEQLNESDLDGNQIVVKKARPRESRPPRRDGGGYRDRGGRGGGDRGGWDRSY